MTIRYLLLSHRGRINRAKWIAAPPQLKLSVESRPPFLRALTRVEQ